MLAFWTPERMHEAEHNIAFPGFPVEGPLLPDLSDEYGYIPSAPPSADNENNYLDNVITRVTEMLFYVQPGSDKAVHCTASIITSESKSVILTARHCVSDRSMWSQNLLFVPAYNGTKLPEHRAPLGTLAGEAGFYSFRHVGRCRGRYCRVAPIRCHRRKRRTAACAGTSATAALPRASTKASPSRSASFTATPVMRWETSCRTWANNIGASPASDPLSDNDPADAMYAPNCSAISGNSGGPLTPLANTNARSGGCWCGA